MGHLNTAVENLSIAWLCDMPCVLAVHANELALVKRVPYTIFAIREVFTKIAKQIMQLAIDHST